MKTTTTSTTTIPKIITMAPQILLTRLKISDEPSQTRPAADGVLLGTGNYNIISQPVIFQPKPAPQELQEPIRKNVEQGAENSSKTTIVYPSHYHFSNYQDFQWQESADEVSQETEENTDNSHDLNQESFDNFDWAPNSGVEETSPSPISLLDIQPLVNGDWLAWLASKSKLKDTKEPTEEETRVEYEKFLKHTQDNSESVYYEEYYDIIEDGDGIDMLEDNLSDNQIFTKDKDRKPFLLSDLNTRDILYQDIIEYNTSTPQYITAQTYSTSQPLYSTEEKTDSSTSSTSTPATKYSEVIDQNNKLMDILKSTLEMQAFLMDKLVSFFVK